MTVWSVSAEFVDKVLSGLTSGQRLDALRRIDEAGSNNWRMGGWFVTGACVLLVLLLVLYAVMSFLRKRQEGKAARQFFASRGGRLGLTPHQLKIVSEIADKSGLPDKDGIFSIEDAFDRGAEKIIEQNLAKGFVREEIVQLKAEIASLREKIGFKNKETEKPGQRVVKANQPTGTRMIPAGRVVYLTRRTTPSDNGIETTIIENNENEIKVRLSIKIKINFGDIWKLRYNYGASVWEFESSVIGYDGSVLRFSHSNNIRFVSRRRFASVPVRQQALMTEFSFAEKSEKEVVEKPDFLPATVIEIAGAWLKLETASQIQTGVRVLVVMKIDKAVARLDGSGFESQTIQDIGEVKHTEQKGNLFIVSVELTGISDSSIDHLQNVAKRIETKTETQVEVISGSNTGR
jgi:hypothetical protein